MPHRVVGRDVGRRRDGLNPARRLTNQLRARVPTRAQKAVRRLMLRWGMVTAPARMLPEVIIVGAQRSGTTTLFRILSEHPQVTRPTLSKGTAFFDLHYDLGMRWYRAHFPTTLAREWAERRHGHPFVAGEATPYYLFHPAAPSRAAAVVPDAKLVVLLRNPVDRAYSGWGLQRAIGTEPLSFEEALDREDERLWGEEQRLVADPTYRSYSHRHHSYKARGRYAEQLDRWFAYFPRDRFLILSSEEYFSEPGETARRTIEFLGLPTGAFPALRSTSASTSGEHLPPSLREHLVTEFAAPNQRLYDLLGRDLGWQ
jgi:hypothetical protein